MKTFLEKEVEKGWRNMVNINKLPEYIDNSKCGFCGRKLKEGRDYVYFKLHNVIHLFRFDSSYNGNVFVDCGRCHRFLMFTDKIRFWIMKFIFWNLL